MKPEAIPTQKPFCPRHLDILLAHGWFRMGRYMYTVNHIGIEDEIRVFWLCYQLSEILLPRSVMEIRKRGNRFDFHYSDLELTKELTDLYHSYRKSIHLDAADSLDQVLYRQEAGKGLPQNFRSKVVEMRDKGRLVAAGIFDHGESAVMGIVNFFLPEYRKFSPGKLMMLKKIDWARENGFQYFYPGYIGAGDSRFDYKLFAGEAGAYLYDPLGYRWYPYEAGLAEFLAKNQVVAIRELNEPQWLDPVHAEKALKHLL
jgi:arginyl-tRNA--protein-N-Asp/Glu arginylyltransferase